MIHDGLWSSFLDQHMGEGTDEVSAELGLTREEQDAWAARSHQRAHAAWEWGRMAEEVVPVEVPQRRGVPVARRSGRRDPPETTPETLAGLRPAFRADGTITAGNASQISDGACAVVVMSAERAEELGVTPLAEIVAYGMSSDRYPSLHTVPAMALERALKRAGLAASDLGLVEINEAFAAVPIHSARMLGVDEEIVNVNGGAVALGHPIGASGCADRPDARRWRCVGGASTSGAPRSAAAAGRATRWSFGRSSGYSPCPARAHAAPRRAPAPP